MHWFRPSEPHHQQQQESQQVDVLDRIEGQATHPARRVVALHMGGQSMTELVYGEAYDQAGQPDPYD